MPNFDYGNARLLGVKSRLIPRQQLELFAGLRSVSALLDVLVDTAYGRFIDAALLRAASLAAAGRMLTQAQHAVSAKLRTFYKGSARRQLDLWLCRYDVRNVKAVLRGTARNAPPYEIERAFYPAGELSQHVLSDLAEQPGVGGVIDRLATLGLSLAPALIRARAEHGVDALPALERALDQWLFRHAAERLKRQRSAGRLREAFALEADVTNLAVVLRIVAADLSVQEWRARLGIEDTDELFVPTGSLPSSMLREAAAQATLDAAVDALSGTPYGDALRSGLRTYLDGVGLGAFEAALQGHRLYRLAGLTRTDRLGIGVPLGVLALKVNEVRNLRWIAQGIYNGLPEARIISRMEFAT